MATDRDSLLRKIQGLMKLSESANEHEAALAAARAVALVEEYNVEQYELEQRTGKVVEKVTLKQVPWPAPADLDRWEKALISIVCEGFYCEVIYNKEYFSIVGRPTDITIVEFTWSTLRSNLVKVVKLRTAVAKKTTYVKNAKKWRRDWLLGAAYGIMAQLSARSSNIAQGSVNAMVIVRDQEVTEFIGATFTNLRYAKVRKIQLSPDAYWEGHDHGLSVSIGTALPDGGTDRRLA